MSTVEVSVAEPGQQLTSPALVSNVSAFLPVSLNRTSAMQRVPLPQAADSEPSLLKMRTKASVPGVRGG